MGRMLLSLRKIPDDELIDYDKFKFVPDASVEIVESGDVAEILVDGLLIDHINSLPGYSAKMIGVKDPKHYPLFDVPARRYGFLWLKKRPAQKGLISEMARLDMEDGGITWHEEAK